MLYGLAIYLQNDLNFSGNITFSVHKDVIMIVGIFHDERDKVKINKYV